MGDTMLEAAGGPAINMLTRTSWGVPWDTERWPLPFAWDQNGGDSEREETQVPNWL